jgi:hypothetical protein
MKNKKNTFPPAAAGMRNRESQNIIFLQVIIMNPLYSPFKGDYVVAESIGMDTSAFYLEIEIFIKDFRINKIIN